MVFLWYIAKRIPHRLRDLSGCGRDFSTGEGWQGVHVGLVDVSRVLGWVSRVGGRARRGFGVAWGSGSGVLGRCPCARPGFFSSFFKLHKSTELSWWLLFRGGGLVEGRGEGGEGEEVGWSSCRVSVLHYCCHSSLLPELFSITPSSAGDTAPALNRGNQVGER